MKQNTLWKVNPYLSHPEDHAAAAALLDLHRHLRSYEEIISHPFRNIVFPQEWKDSNPDTDNFLSILLQSFNRYINYLTRDERLLWILPLPFLIKFGSPAEIDAFDFPEPQLIPTEPNMEYHARMLKAFLHIFSYPGLSTCRCGEMESERSTTFLLYSFFDWFGTVSYGSSVNEKHSTVRIFNRYPTPQWKTEGFMPIVFLSQSLRPTSKEKGIYYHLRDGFDINFIPPFLIPLVSAVQSTLQSLLLREIAKWKKNRTSLQKNFILPKWLFVHGLFHDGVEIQLYSCIPCITECDADGVPSKWHFECISAGPDNFYPFRSPSTFIRLSTAITLLQIQRHTTRVSKELRELLQDADITECGPSFSFDSATLGERTSPAKTSQDLIDNMDPDESKIRAETSLSECMSRAGLCLTSLQNDSLSEWTFSDNTRYNTKTRSRRFLDEFLENWRPASGILPIPQDWLTPPPDPLEPGSNMEEKTTWDWKSFHIEVKFQLRLRISPQVANFIPTSEDDLRARHFSPVSFAPDFYLSTPARKFRPESSPICMEDLSLDTLHASQHFRDAVHYMAHELDAKFAMSSSFMCTPGCWLKCDTESRFPPALAAGSVSVDFSLLLHPIQTVPIKMTPITPDINLRATILNPALVVAIQGPTPWPAELSHASSLTHTRPKNKAEALKQLATAIEPNLKIHLINWQLRFEQGLTPSRDLPPWFMLFGIIYDAEEVNIVAHIPVRDDDTGTTTAQHFSFVSCVLDTISFPPATPSSKVTEPWYLDRFRVGLALFSIQKHAFHMAQLWEGVAWPDDLISWEEIIEREYLGPVLTPAERGYMTTPNPMVQLYLQMHGSDILFDDDDDDNTPTVSEEIHVHDEGANNGSPNDDHDGDDECDESSEAMDVGTTGGNNDNQAGGQVQTIDELSHISRNGSEGPEPVMSKEPESVQLCSDTHPHSEKNGGESYINPQRMYIESWRAGIEVIPHPMDILPE